MSASSDSDSSSSGSRSIPSSPPLPPSVQHQPSGFPRDSLPRRYASRQESGSRPTGFGTLPSLPQDQATSSFTPSLGNSPSMSSESRRQSMIAMDRKRRLTGSNSSHEHGRRRYTPTEFLTRTRSDEQNTPPEPYMQRPARQPSMSAVRSEAPHHEVVDLTGSSPPPLPPPPPPHSPPRHNQPSRTSSSSSRRYTVPPWQADSEVSHCPICKRQFTWMFRRHHCRKCGRVVCDNCSPHRITIPRQFIVNPPRPDSASSPTRGEVETIDLTGDDEGEEASHFRRRSRHASMYAAEGGEKVRLCNPCVPDPQPDPPSPLFSPFPDNGSANPPHTNIFGQPRRPPPPPQLPFSHTPRDMLPPSRLEYSTSLGSRPRPASVTNPYSMYFPDPEQRRHAGLATRGDMFPGNRINNNPLPQLPGMGQFPSSNYGHGRYLSLDTQNRPQPSVPGRPRGSSMFDMEPRHGMMSSSYGRPPMPASSRPRLHERDICPVCRRALPPKGENGDETLREAHIMACINMRDPSSSATTEAGNSSRGPVHMVGFTASEKDCVGEEGNVQECSICMVEYDVGDELARLECFCKFHKECIVSWLNRKAECPVHKAARFNI